MSKRKKNLEVKHVSANSPGIGKSLAVGKKMRLMKLRVHKLRVKKSYIEDLCGIPLKP